MFNTPLKDLKVKQLPAVFAVFCFVGCIMGFFTSLLLVLAMIDEPTADDLALQIAQKTHKVEATTNEFGTLEWRIVEVKKEGMEE